MVPGLKFSSTTSALATSLRRMARPSGAFMLRVRLFLLRLTERKYVASPPAKGGQPRVSSPLPGSSTLMISAPMSPSDIEQNGPASTRVRSMTRIPASGGLDRFPTRAFCLAFATGSSLEEPLGQALGNGRDLLAAGTGPPPEEPRPVGITHVGEVEHAVEGFDPDPRADPDAARLLAVAEEPRAPLELDQRDVQRSLEALGRRVERGEGHDLADSGHGGGLHGDRVVGAVAGAWHHDALAARAARGPDGLDDHGRASRSVTQLFVASPPIDCASATRAETWRPSAMPRSCQQSSTICAMPVAASGCPRALRPPEVFTGSRPSSAVSPSSVARPALPVGMSPVSSREISSKGEKASWISASSTRSGPKPAIPYATCAAAWVARKEVSSLR